MVAWALAGRAKGPLPLPFWEFLTACTYFNINITIIRLYVIFISCPGWEFIRRARLYGRLNDELILTKNIAYVFILISILYYYLLIRKNNLP